MPNKGEIGLAKVMAMEPSHNLLFIKSLIMKSALKDFSWWDKNNLDDKESKLIVKEFVRIEIITTTVHYSEVFAAQLMGMNRFKRFHKFLLEYKPWQIKRFYENIPHRRDTYIAKLLQYPQLYQVQFGEHKKELKESLIHANSELKKLAKFYLDFYKFYNSYKHGLRMFTGKPDPDNDFTITGYVSNRDRLDQFKVGFTEKDVDLALDLCEFMFRFLNNAENVFLQQQLEKKKEFKFTLYKKNLKNKS